MTAASLEGNADNLTSASLTPYEAALSYAALGLHVVPIIPGEKFPPMLKWQDEATVDADTIRQWWTVNYKGYGVGIAPRQLPDSGWLVVIDVDDNEAKNKHGSETLADLEATYRPLPATWTVHSGGGGRHLFFRSPVELPSATNKPGPSIDVRARGGQSVAPPTIHPKTGRPYVWDIELNPDTIPLADAPGWLVEMLLPEPPKPRPPARHEASDPTLPGNRYNAATTWRELLEPDGWQFSHYFQTGVEGWTRPGKAVRDGISATIGYEGNDLLHVFSGSVTFPPPGKSYSRWAYMTYRDYGGDFSASASAINNDPRFTPQLADYLNELDDTAKSGGADLHQPIDRAPAEKDGADLHQVINRAPKERPTLPDDFWCSTPTLQHIRDMARHYRVPPQFVLLQVLVRLSAIVPPSYCVPGLRASKKNLSLGGVIVANSSAGKSASGDAADELLGDTFLGVLLNMPVGSGEGIMETYLEEMSETIDGKKVNVKKQVYEGVHFNIDEGDQLEALTKQQSSTLISVLKTLLMGGGTGTAKADKKTSRQLKKLDYTAGLSISIQPAKARFLFDDLKGGFPQRLLFVTDGDPGRPPAGQRPPNPGPLKFKRPPGNSGMGQRFHHDILFPDEVWLYFDQLAVDSIDGKNIDELDGHIGIITAKVAALLAILHDNKKGNIYEVTMFFWNLAVVIAEKSSAVRNWLQGTHLAEDASKEQAATVKAVKRNRALNDDDERRALEAAVRAVAKKVAKGVGQQFNRSELHSAVAYKHRKLVAMDDVIAEAVARRHVGTTSDGRYCLGAKPL